MRRKILFIILTIVLAAGLIGGGTMAWFTAKAQVQNEFTAGTVMVNPGSAEITGEIDVDNWNPGDCAELKWGIHNPGSKDILVRIKNGDQFGYETAMARMNDDPDDFEYQWTNHPWFSYLEYVTYNGGYERETRYLYAAQTHRVGEVDIWKSNGYLMLEITMDEGFEMTESHVHVQLDPDEYQPPAKFGTWPYKQYYNPAEDYAVYQIPWETEWDDQELYIAVHADVYGDYGKDGGKGLGKKGKWEFKWEWLWENWNALCFSARGCEILNEAYREGVSYEDIKDTYEWALFVSYVEGLENPVSLQLCDNQDWVLKEDGYFYYTGPPIEHCQTVEFCLKVCFEGELANNVFQGAKYKLTLPVEAVQASNDAPYHVWGFNP